MVSSYKKTMEMGSRGYDSFFHYISLFFTWSSGRNSIRLDRSQWGNSYCTRVGDAFPFSRVFAGQYDAFCNRHFLGDYDFDSRPFVAGLSALPFILVACLSTNVHRRYNRCFDWSALGATFTLCYTQLYFWNIYDDYRD